MDRVVEIGLVIAAVTVTAQSVAHLVGVFLLDDRYLHLNADDEHGLVAWMSSAVTFVAAFAALLLALLPEEIDRRLLALAGIVAFFSLDDAVVVHERVGEKIADAFGYGETAPRLIWPIVFLPLFVVALLLLVDAGRRLLGRFRQALWLGIGLLTAAVAAELLSSVVYELEDVERGSWPDALQVIVEEGAELGGWIVIAAAFVAALLAGLSEERAPGGRTLPA